MRIASEKGYSDVHLGVGEEPRYRARGEMAGTGWPITDAATFNGWMREMLSPAEIDAFQRDKDVDGSHAFSFVRVRINLLDSLRGPAMVLVTGPTGSGKSTTLAAMIDWINRTMSRHILTIEDPVEFVHESRQLLIRHREVGRVTAEDAISQSLKPNELAQALRGRTCMTRANGSPAGPPATPTGRPTGPAWPGGHSRSPPGA